MPIFQQRQVHIILCSVSVNKTYRIFVIICEIAHQTKVRWNATNTCFYPEEGGMPTETLVTTYKTTKHIQQTTVQIFTTLKTSHSIPYLTNNWVNPFRKQSLSKQFLIIQSAQHRTKISSMDLCKYIKLSDLN